MIMKIRILVSVLLFTFIFISCDDYSELEAPVKQPVQTGSADFTRFVAIGNSITAGFYQSGTIYQSGQMHGLSKLDCSTSRNQI